MPYNEQLNIVVLVPREQPEILEAVQSLDASNTATMSGAGFGGEGEFWQVVCTLGAAGITGLVAILRARLAQSKNVIIEVDGMRVTGANPDKVEEILKMMLKANDDAT